MDCTNVNGMNDLQDSYESAFVLPTLM